MKRLTNDDIKFKYGFPKELKIKGKLSNIIYQPKRKLKNDLHWTCYLYDRNLKKQVWIEISKEQNINQAITLSKQSAIDYYLNNKDKKIITKQNDISNFIVSKILEDYIEHFLKEQYKKIDNGEKLKSVVNRHISSKEANKKAIENYFGNYDIRDLTELHFERFMNYRLKQNISKGSIGNNLSLFTTGINHTLQRNAGKRRTRAIQDLNEELKRLITLIRYFRQDHDLTVQAVLKKSKKNKTNGHGKIDYFKFREIIEWLRSNDKIDNVYADFYLFLYFMSNRGGEGSRLQKRNIIITGDSVKLKIPPILTKDGVGGLYSLHIEVEEIFKRRIKGLQDEDYIFSIYDKKTKERKALNGYYYRKIWDKVRKHFGLKLSDGQFMPVHILRHSAVQNISESEQANISAFTRQSPKIVDHYLSDETKNKNELLQLLAWQAEQEEKYQELEKEKTKIAVEKNIEFLDNFVEKEYKETD